jgi:predicted RNase H-like nuclease
VAPSYDTFLALSSEESVNWSQTSFPGSAPDASAILAAAHHLLGSDVDLITIDMPVATVPIIGRRAADTAISKQFGGRWCSAHSPSSSRPGVLGSELSTKLRAAGYSLATSTTAVPKVYPHPALLSLMKCSHRVRYKVSKSRRYWPQFTVHQRIDALLTQFLGIRDALTGAFGSVPVPLPPAANITTLSIDISF